MACFLMDFLDPLSSEAQKEKVLASPEFKEWEQLEKDCDVMLEMGYFTGDSEQLSKPERVVLKQEKRLLDTIWKRYQYIPNQMQYSALGYREKYGKEIELRQRDMDIAEALHDFSDLPRVKLANLRNAATKLNYMILPVRYVDEKVIDNIILRELQSNSYDYHSKVVYKMEEAKSIIAEIANFTKQDLYMLCPVSFYDLCRAEQDKEPREMIFGGELTRVKALLDTITKIQRNLFAILDGNEADTDVWEIGEGSECSEKELMHLRILVETIMPIQHSLLEIAQQSRDMESWEETMRKNHHGEISGILRRMSKQLSWSAEAEQALKERYLDKIEDPHRASRVISEAAAMTDVIIFALPCDTSLVYGDGLARVFGSFSVGMSEDFYLNRGFSKQDKKANKLWTSEFHLSF